MLLEQRGTEALRKTDRKIYELVNRISPPFLSSEVYHQGTFNALRNADEEIYDLITEEYKRLRNTIQLTAAGNMCSQAVLAALGSVVQNKTTEGFVGGRCHGGCEVVDAIEALAVERSEKSFRGVLRERSASFRQPGQPDCAGGDFGAGRQDIEHEARTRGTFFARFGCFVCGQIFRGAKLRSR